MVGRAGVIAALLFVVVVGAEVPAIASGSGPVVTVAVRSNLGPVNEKLLGTNQPIAGAGPVVSPLGIDWARTDMSLDAAYSCPTGRWDPSVLDQRVQDDLAMGGVPELIVDYSPPCMTTNPLHEGLDPPDAGGYGPWRALVEEAAYHEMVTYGVRIFEVWNEPDGTFWHATIADYLAMYKATAEAIGAAAARAGINDVSIGGPALLFSDPLWLEPFLAYVNAQHLPLGFVSWHYYGDYPALGPFATSAGVLPPQIPALGDYWYNPLTRAEAYGLQVVQVKDEIAKYPGLHPLTVIDEWNLDAGYDPRADQPYDAAFAAAVLDSVQAAGLDRMAFFRVADDHPGTLGNWGMLRSDLTPKPVYWAFDFWHHLAGTRLATHVSGADLGAVASAGSAGVINVMVYHYVPYGAGSPASVVLRLDGLGRGRWNYTVRMIDGDHSGEQVAGGTLGRSVTLFMPPESVALVTLNRT